MNKYFVYIALIIFISFSACNKKQTCNTLETSKLDVSYSDDGKVVFFAFKSSISYSDIQMEYGKVDYTAGNGTSFESFQIASLAEGAYDVYFKLQCDGDTWSDWSQKVSFTILDSTKICFPPISIYTVDLGCEAKFGWYRNNKGLEEDYYEVEYGITGFELGTGTNATVNGIEYKDAVLTKGNSYDFYVRTFCGSSWGEFSAVESFFAENNFNRCLVPKNVDAFRSGSNLTYAFNGDGDCEFEYTLITSVENVGDKPIYNTTKLSHTGQFSNITSFSTYHFMVRTVCKDGTKTDWVTKVVLP